MTRSILYTNPYVWGPSAWHFLHCVTLASPKRWTTTEKTHYRCFFRSLGYVLPCKKCRLHFKNWWSDKVFKEKIHSRNDLVRWFIDFHNHVNVRLGYTKISYTRALKTIRARCLQTIPEDVDVSCKHNSK